MESFFAAGDSPVYVEQITDNAFSWRWRVPIETLLSQRSIHSEEFGTDEHRWKVFIQRSSGNVGFFLESVTARTRAYADGMHVISAHFRIRLLARSGTNLERHTAHRFSYDDNDLGWAEFISTKDIRSDSCRFVHALEKHERIAGLCTSSRCSAPHDSLFVEIGILDHSLPLPARPAVRNVGLRNSGQTCYLNALTQSLFAIPALRQLVYESVPPPAEATTSPSRTAAQNTRQRNVVIALQRLLGSLQLADPAADGCLSTDALTASFGWTQDDLLEQHDLHEFLVKLRDLLSEVPGTGARITKLFRGTMESYVRCTDVPFESTREEPFEELTVPVSGCADLSASFSKEIETEVLEGANAYHTGDARYGMQRAEKGVRFTSFPDVLFVLLRRMEFDLSTMEMRKVMERHVYTTALDAGPFLSGPGGKPADPAAVADAKFTLLSVLVHEGGGRGGHYYSYVNTKPSEPDAEKAEWARMDDASVQGVPSENALSDCFGGRHPKKFWMSTAMAPCAYLLVYVRTSALKRLLLTPASAAPVMPPDLRKMVVSDLQERRMEAKERGNVVRFRLITPAQCEAYDARTGGLHNELVDFAHPSLNGDNLLRVARDGTLADIMSATAARLRVPPTAVRLWTMVLRRNRTIRIDNPITVLEEEDSIVTLADTEPLITVFPRHEVVDLFVETYARGGGGGGTTGTAVAPLPRLRPSSSMVFCLRYYSPAWSLPGSGWTATGGDVCAFRYAGTIVASSTNDTLYDLREQVERNLAHFGCPHPPGNSLLWYDEMKPGSIDTLDPAKTLAELNLVTGDILLVADAHPPRGPRVDAASPPREPPYCRTAEDALLWCEQRQYIHVIPSRDRAVAAARAAFASDPGAATAAPDALGVLVLAHGSDKHATLQRRIAAALGLGGDDVERILVLYTAASSGSPVPLLDGSLSTHARRCSRLVVDGTEAIGLSWELLDVRADRLATSHRRVRLEVVNAAVTPLAVLDGTVPVGCTVKSALERLLGTVSPDKRLALSWITRGSDVRTVAAVCGHVITDVFSSGDPIDTGTDDGAQLHLRVDPTVLPPLSLDPRDTSRCADVAEQRPAAAEGGSAAHAAAARRVGWHQVHVIHTDSARHRHHRHVRFGKPFLDYFHVSWTQRDILAALSARMGISMELVKHWNVAIEQTAVVSVPMRPAANGDCITLERALQEIRAVREREGHTHSATSTPVQQLTVCCVERPDASHGGGKELTVR